MDDIMGKIGELLSDGESVKQLSELAQMFMSETNDSETSDSSEESSANSNEETAESGFDLSLIFKIQEIMGVMNQKDKNSELLLALKPHLKDDKQEKVDKAVKILKLLAVWNILKDSGLLQNLL